MGGEVEVRGVEGGALEVLVAACYTGHSSATYFTKNSANQKAERKTCNQWN